MDNPILGLATSVVVEIPRPRVSVEIETMARGPAKVTVRIDGTDAEAVSAEAFATYRSMVRALSDFERQLAVEVASY